jgi:hypothetical protein
MSGNADIIRSMQLYHENTSQFLQSIQRRNTVDDAAITIQYEFPRRPTGVASTSSRPTFTQMANSITLLTYHPDSGIDPVDPISHSQYEEGEVLCRINRCQHVFQYRYLMEWIDVSQTCPLCRTPLIATNPDSEQRAPRRTESLEQLLRVMQPIAEFDISLNSIFSRLI